MVKGHPTGWGLHGDSLVSFLYQQVNPIRNTFLGPLGASKEKRCGFGGGGGGMAVGGLESSKIIIFFPSSFTFSEIEFLD